MASVTIRNLDDTAKQIAREEAAAHGRSLEAELRDLIERTYGRRHPTDDKEISRRPGEGIGDYLVRISRPGFDDVDFERDRSPAREVDL